jgi:hypothetical protein
MIKNIQTIADWGLVAFVGFFDENMGQGLNVDREYPSDT